MIEKEYKEGNGSLKVIIKHGMGHYPHSLETTDEIIEFLCYHKLSCNKDF